MQHFSHPRGAAVLLALLIGACIVLAAVLRARRSRYPILLYVCAGWMAVLHGVWIQGLLSRDLFAAGLGTLFVLTFPWCMAVTNHMTMAGFGTLHDMLLNYARFVLGFGGLQALLFCLVLWEWKLTPRRLPGARSSQRASRHRS